VSDTHAHARRGLSGVQEGKRGGDGSLPSATLMIWCDSACQPIDVPPAADRGARLPHLVTRRGMYPDPGVLRRPSNVRLSRQARTGATSRQSGGSA
jgi:hypothetical protein